MKKRILQLALFITVLSVVCTGSVFAGSSPDIWFGTSATDSTPISSLLVDSGSEFNLYIYSSSSANLWGASYDIAFNNDFSFVSWTVDNDFLNYIGGIGEIAIDGLDTMADEITTGYVFETGPINKSPYTGLVGTLDLKNELSSGANGSVYIWSDLTSWSKSSAIYDADTYGTWISKDLEVKTTYPSTTAVPEVSSVLSMVLGLGGLGLFRRYKK